MATLAMTRGATVEPHHDANGLALLPWDGRETEVWRQAEGEGEGKPGPGLYSQRRLGFG